MRPGSPRDEKGRGGGKVHGEVYGPVHWEVYGFRARGVCGKVHGEVYGFGTDFRTDFFNIGFVTKTMGSGRYGFWYGFFGTLF